MNCPDCGHLIERHEYYNASQWGCRACEEEDFDTRKMLCALVPAQIELHYWRAEALAAREYISKTHIPQPRRLAPGENELYYPEDGLYPDYQAYLAARVPETP